jgi:hypothetical protein
MLKIFLKYQRILSIPASFANEKKHSKPTFFIIFIYMLIVISLALIFAEDGLIFYSTVFTLFRFA